ncbi:MAG: hypothetical protein HUK01_08425 [Bacteroidaceae bacterium]|nr:hypothetical protein [Bacteroidaceae bacterium]MCF0184343.1 hypothetical protein [Bacteroidaceae bacterium]
MSPLAKLGNVPFDLGVLASTFPGTKHVTEKARRLEAEGKIMRVKRGLYVASPDETGKTLNRYLIANHLYGPSYVSLQTALRHYGLIPERVHMVQSLTTKHARSFDTPVGHFTYESCDKDYFAAGVRVEREDGITYLIATPEKALCDLINYSKGVNLRFMRDVACYLEEDIRLDMDTLRRFDLSIIERCAAHSRKGQNINTLIKFIRHERNI